MVSVKHLAQAGCHKALSVYDKHYSSAQPAMGARVIYQAERGKWTVLLGGLMYEIEALESLRFWRDLGVGTSVIFVLRITEVKFPRGN